MATATRPGSPAEPEPTEPTPSVPVPAEPPAEHISKPRFDDGGSGAEYPGGR